MRVVALALVFSTAAWADATVPAAKSPTLGWQQQCVARLEQARLGIAREYPFFKTREILTYPREATGSGETRAMDVIHTIAYSASERGAHFEVLLSLDRPPQPHDDADFEEVFGGASHHWMREFVSIHVSRFPDFLHQKPPPYDPVDDAFMRWFRAAGEDCIAMKHAANGGR